MKTLFACLICLYSFGFSAKNLSRFEQCKIAEYYIKHPNKYDEVTLNQLTDVAQCQAWMDGILDASRQLAVYLLSGLKEERRTDKTFEETALFNVNACIPRRTTRDQLIQIYVQYLNKHPEKQHLKSISTLILSLSLVYPCKDGFPFVEKSSSMPWLD